MLGTDENKCLQGNMNEFRASNKEVDFGFTIVSKGIVKKT